MPTVPSIDVTPLYALAGAGDVAVNVLRKRAAELSAQARTLQVQARALPTRVQELPAFVQELPTELQANLTRRSSRSCPRRPPRRRGRSGPPRRS
jgi:hypothetical protein